jgi:hypothetical protein
MEKDAPMRQTVYALRLRGEAKWVGIDGNLLRIVARASGSSMRTWFDRDGLHGEVRDEQGDEICLESELTITGATTYQEVGTIDCGQSGDRLRFSTCGSGHLEHVVEGASGRGAAVLQVDDGEGRFVAAHGLMAATHVVDTTGAITILLLGSIVLRDGGSVATADGPAGR